MKLEFKGLTFYNLPQRLKTEDYEEVVDLAVKDLKTNPSIISIYLMGKNWLPGISDVDIVAVHKDDAIRVHPKKPFGLSKKAKYIFIHSYINYNLSSFRNIHFIYPSKFQLYHLAGAKIDFIQPITEITPLQFNHLKVSFIVDCLINKLLLTYYIFTKKIDTRLALLWLNSFIYTLQLTEEVIGKKIKTDFPTRITNLRNRWFERKEKENLEELTKIFEESFELTVNIVNKIDDFLKENFQLGKTSSGLVFNSPYFYILGADKWQKEKFLDSRQYYRFKNPFSGIVLKQYRFLVPDSFFVIFNVYSQFNGHYSKWFKQFLNKQALDLDIKDKGIRKRVEYLNKIPADEHNEILTNTLIQYGFHSCNLKKEWFKVKIMNFLRRLNLN